MENFDQQVQFILLTAALLALIFVILYLVGRKKNREFQEHREEILSLHKIGPRDIVLLKDGRRVTITEPIDDGTAFSAETIPDSIFKRADKLTVQADEIEKSEYYANP